MNTFPTKLYRVYQDDEGNTKSELVVDEHGNPVDSQEAIAIRDALVERISLLPPVNGLLDQINWHFGADKVSEVTGRSKRILFKDGKYQLTVRASSSNIAETTAFQADEKQILVFSQAGGTGRSYHADLNCQNQRLRRHYLVEAGWEAISAVQGFGRSHRSNQKQPPEVILLTTTVKGEVRFTSTIAARLSSLGAITKGQRDTGNNGLFKEDTNNFSSQYAKTALIEFYQALYRHGIDGISAGEFSAFTGLKLTDTEGNLRDDLPKMTTFLNRLLALPINLQNRLFADFEERINRRIAQAKANGSYERGVETLWADGGFEIIESKILETHTAGGETICYAIDKLKKPRILTVNDAKSRIDAGLKCYRHRKNGKVAIAKHQDSRTKRSGDIVDVIRIYRPTHIRSSEDIDLPDFERQWELTSTEESFWWSWQTEIDNSPEFHRGRLYLVCGLLLPVWDRLPGEYPKIFRLQANDGRVLLGRSVDSRQINSVYTKFGIDDRIKLSANDIYQLVWDDHQSYKVKDKWTLVKTYLKGDFRLEISQVYDADDVKWLKTIGCFTEMISFRTRVFIPLDRAVEIIELLKSSV
jgi:hypothetical protein